MNDSFFQPPPQWKNAAECANYFREFYSEFDYQDILDEFDLFQADQVSQTPHYLANKMEYDTRLDVIVERVIEIECSKSTARSRVESFREKKILKQLRDKRFFE